MAPIVFSTCRPEGFSFQGSPSKTALPLARRARWELPVVALAAMELMRSAAASTIRAPSLSPTVGFMMDWRKVELAAWEALTPFKCKPGPAGEGAPALVEAYIAAARCCW